MDSTPHRAVGRVGDQCQTGLARRWRIARSGWCSLLVGAMLASQVQAGGVSYRVPSPEIAAIIDEPLTPATSIDPTRRWLLLLERPSLPGIEELAEPEVGLAGMRFSPQTNGPSRRRPSSGMQLLRIADGQIREVEGLPENPRIDDEEWSRDGRRLIFTNTSPEGIELWMLETESARARRLTGPVVSMIANVSPHWLDESNLVFFLVPPQRRPAPEKARVPTGPVVQESQGEKAPAATYQDLLASPYDEDLFDHLLTSVLVRIDIEGKITSLGPEDLYWDCHPSPDGRYLLLERLHRPYSYLVTAGRFPKHVELWTAAGERVREIYDSPLQEQIPLARGSVANGPRSFDWRADVPATLIWAEALDGGDAGQAAEYRDQIYTLEAPFRDSPKPLLNLSLRYREIRWATSDFALVSSWEWKTRRTLTQVFRPDQPEREPVTLFDRSWEDRYADPGIPLTRRNEFGRTVALLVDDGQALLLSGDGASPDGKRPFLDRFDLQTRETHRLFQSEAPYYERVITPLDEQAEHLLMLRESVEEPPNFFDREIGGAAPRQLTHFPHPTPQLAGIQKEIVHFERSDGVDLTGTLYLPAGYDVPRDGPLPLLMWAYPREYKSAEAAGQVRDSPYQFDRVGWSSPLVWLLRGYAVLDDPAMPIIGEGEMEPNDTYVEQLVADAEAAVSAMISRGVATSGRIAIGGHSYGAFMTANLLAHTDLFAAGIARSGAYNRALTPFGFQAEERTYWETPEVYHAMSPFTYADQINEPLLLIHGELDNNPGTDPMQSERLYDALKGLGGTARLVLLPQESHSYRARESILHLLWETENWLDTHVGKGAAPPAPSADDTGH